LHLRTENLHLRSLASEDAAAVFAIMSDPETMQFWDWPPIREFETASEIVEAQIAEMEAGGARYWAVAFAPLGPAIGFVDLSALDYRHRRAELGFLFDRAHWGKGHARQAMTWVMAHAWDDLRLERLWARCHAGNIRSRKLLESLGFVCEGLLRGHILRDDERRDCAIYGRLRA
jgi:RimJ/RimL family protein N-acetyltransferase